MRERRSKQLDLGLKFRGGKRKGAGRKNRSGCRAHTKRPRVNGREPLHVTIKLRDGWPNLRRKEVLRTLKLAVARAREKGFQLAHYALLSNHMHLIVEASDNRALTSGMKSLSISLALHLKELLKSQDIHARGAFHGRYHLHILKTPGEVKRALAYVLTNEAKHLKQSALSWNIFSSLAMVEDLRWLLHLTNADPQGSRAKRRDETIPTRISLQAPPPSERAHLRSEVTSLCQPPRTWLLRSGWLRAS